MNNDDLDSGATLRGLAAGQHMFNRYKLIRVLGQGGMGVVWLAHDETLDQDVALKFLPEAVARDEEALRDLKRETKRALRLTHPRIVRIYDFVSDARNAAVSMEYVDGRTLTSLKLEAAEGCLGTAELAPWIGQLCEALTYAHNEAGVVHRDLKPANLMIDSKGTLKVTDFGISATITDSTTRASTNAASTSGTPVYMSPQQMLGTRAAPTDDVYSLGATIYELLTGKPPFYSGNIPMQVQGVVPSTMAERRKELGVEDASPIPEAWEKTVAACLAKEAKDRPQSAAEVWAFLEGDEAQAAKLRTMTAETARHSSDDLSAGETVANVARPNISGESVNSRTEKPQAPARKSKGLLYGALAAGGLAVAACGWWYGIRAPELARQAEQARQQAAAYNASWSQLKTATHEGTHTQSKLFDELDALEADAKANARGTTLVIDSAPSGVEVIDSAGKNCGATPLRFENMNPGRYTLTLKKSGYEDATVSGDVAKHETLRLYATMKEAARPAEPQAVQASTPSDTNNSGVPTVGSNYTVPEYNIEMVWIAPGSFMMGSPESEAGHKTDEIQHNVTLTKGYWLGKYEVTQGQWKAVMGNNPSSFKNAGINVPVEMVSWDDAIAFCEKITEKERAAKRLPSEYEYSLPTEAMWEYASKGNRSGTHSRNENLDDMGWYVMNSGSTTHPVGQKQVNAWGLYDMQGNVWEWCYDWLGDYPSVAATDPTGPNVTASRVGRGGSWLDNERVCRSAFRSGRAPGDHSPCLGFRLALRPVQ